MTTDDPDAVQTVLVGTNHDVAQATQEQEVINQVKNMKSQALFKNKPSRFTRYQEMPMTTTLRSNRSIASLHLPKQVPALINLGKGVIQSMTGNASFPAPEPSLAALTAALSELETAEAAALGRTRGAVTTRNNKRAALVTLLDQLKGYVQKVADANLEQGAAMIQSAGIGVKKTAVRPKRVFSARPGLVSGAVKLMTESAGHRASYEWQYSIDAAKTWVAVPMTLQAKTTITGLQPGVMATFRYRAVTKAGEGDWSQPLAIIVK